MGLPFRPGQYVSIGIPGDIDMREYSIYSTPEDDYLEVLIKEVEGGLVSRKLRRLRPGDFLSLRGPFGSFMIDEQTKANRRFLFVATGSGIAPFHCFARAYPGLDYTLLHGTRSSAERYDADTYESHRYLSCLSRESGGDFSGRVTDYLRFHPISRDNLCYLCGSCDMIYEAMAILTDQGVPREQLFAEVYY